MKRFTAIFISVLCAIVSMFSLVACDNDGTGGGSNNVPDGGSQTVAVESVKLNKTTITLDIGETETLTATVYPDNATNKKITWSADKPEIADVDKASGKVTAKTAGTATVTATVGGKSATCAVTVNSNADKPPVDDVIRVTSVTLDKSAITLDVGETETITATVLPNNATDKTVTWSVSPVGIVTVDGGKVTAVSDGAATVTATADGKSATCAVTVNKLEPSEGLLYTLNEDNESYTVTKGDSTDTTVVIPSEYNGLPVTTIGKEAFQDCESITQVIVPDSVTVIEDFAFAKCKSLADAKIPNGVTTIGNYAFYQCTSLTRVDIPDSVTKIGDYAFMKCESVVSVTIGSGLVTMGNMAFYNCYRVVEVYNLSALTIEKKSNGPNNCYLAAYAFDVYTSSDDESKLVETDDCVFYEDGDTVYLICYTGGSSDITLPDDFNSKAYNINSYAFLNCTSLESISLSDGVESIGNSAFQGCSSLGSITLPDSVESIGSGAFFNCAALESIKLPAGITTIGDSMFNNCYALESITLPDSVTGNIGARAFNGCKSLKSITLPEGVTYIKEFAFNGCTTLKSVTLPATLSAIEVWAFGGCSALDTVYYKGTEAAWGKIKIGSNESNQPIVDATRYYYSENEPGDGAFWHYDTDGVTPVIW